MLIGKLVSSLARTSWATSVCGSGSQTFSTLVLEGGVTTTEKSTSYVTPLRRSAWYGRLLSSLSCDSCAHRTSGEESRIAIAIKLRLKLIGIVIALLIG